MMLSGNLSDWSVGDLLQMLHITKKTASLHIDGTDRSGVVHFESGAIVNAEVSLGGPPGGQPRDEVVEAVYVLELLDEGLFEIKNEVPPRTIEPLAVAEALELAGQHLDAERHLDETGLLSARGLRLAQTIAEPIILSEQVWNAISVSIPAFTFPELEARLGRAGAVATIEQFRDLGILEAVLEDIEPAMPKPEAAHTPDPTSVGVNGRSAFDDIADEDVDSQLAEAFAESWTPPAPEEVEMVSFVGQSDETAPYDQPIVHHDQEIAHQEIVHHDQEIAHQDQIVPEYVEEVRPIVTDAPDDSIVVPDAEPIAAQRDTAPSGLTPGASSLSAAIRAAAGASASGGASDDESRLLSEAAGDPTAEQAEATAEHSTDDGSLRRTVKSLVSPPETPLVSGVLGDLGSRFRQAAAAEQDD
jgi:hypothetical protein